MRRSILAAACSLALLTGAAVANEPPPADRRPAATPALPAEAEPPPVKQVALDPNAPQPVCRRYAPTGSRISEERCDMRNANGKKQSAEREQIRRDLDEMRARQAMREQARAQALAEALRRR